MEREEEEEDGAGRAAEWGLIKISAQRQKEPSSQKSFDFAAAQNEWRPMERKASEGKKTNNSPVSSNLL